VYLKDAIGTVRAEVYDKPLIIPTAAGKPENSVTEREWEYTAYGEVRSGSLPGVPKIGFTGYLNDGESGLYYAINRHYDAARGRFISRDPITIYELANSPAGLNKYWYCKDNPTRYTDPRGEYFGIDDAICAGIGMIGGICRAISMPNSNAWDVLLGGLSGAVTGEANLYTTTLLGGTTVDFFATTHSVSFGAGWMGVVGGNVGYDNRNGGSFTVGGNLGVNIGGVSGGINLSESFNNFNTSGFSTNDRTTNFGLSVGYGSGNDSFGADVNWSWNTQHGYQGMSAGLSGGRGIGAGIGGETGISMNWDANGNVSGFGATFGLSYDISEAYGGRDLKNPITYSTAHAGIGLNYSNQDGWSISGYARQTWDTSGLVADQKRQNIRNQINQGANAGVANPDGETHIYIPQRGGGGTVELTPEQAQYYQEAAADADLNYSAEKDPSGFRDEAHDALNLCNEKKLSPDDIIPDVVEQMRNKGFEYDDSTGNFYNKTTGVVVAVYQDNNSNKVMLSIMGYGNHDPDGWFKGWVTNITQSVGIDFYGQYQSAMDVGSILQYYYKDNLVITGTSLGGGLASAAGFVTHAKTITFNAAGLSPSTVGFNQFGVDNAAAMLAHSGNITAYDVTGEFLYITQNQAWNWAPVAAGNWMTIQPPSGFEDDPFALHEPIATVWTLR
jgi:RHS repeat-associated protein